MGRSSGSILGVPPDTGKAGKAWFFDGLIHPFCLSRNCSSRVGVAVDPPADVLLVVRQLYRTCRLVLLDAHMRTARGPRLAYVRHGFGVARRLPSAAPPNGSSQPRRAIRCTAPCSTTASGGRLAGVRSGNAKTPQTAQFMVCLPVGGGYAARGYSDRRNRYALYNRCGVVADLAIPRSFTLLAAKEGHAILI